MNDLTLVIPAKKEGESLPLVLEELKKYDLNLLVILEPSDLETINAIKNYKCEIVYQKNKGYGDAILLGIQKVKTEFFCIFNADGSFNPAELNGMYKKLKNDNFDIVFASRYEENCGTDDDTIITMIGNYLFTIFGRIFFRLKITDILYTYVMAKTIRIKNLDLKSKDFKLCVELPIKSQKAKLNITTSKSYERSRISGFKKVNAFKDGLLILLGMIKLFFNKL